MHANVFALKSSSAFFCLLTAAFFPVGGAEWPNYRGPGADGVCPETVNLNWPTSGPKVVWKVPTKNGFSSFSVTGGKVFTQVNRDLDGALREICVALDAATGKEIWFADVGVGKYDQGGDSGAPDNKGGDGPRSTPTVNAGKVYVFNQFLVLFCLDAQTGKQLWTRDLIKENTGRNIPWKSAASPVVDGEVVFIGGGGPGESLLAVNKDTGAVVWKSQDEFITHATPVVADILGVRQVIFFARSGLVSVAAKDGALLWRFPFEFKTSTAASPVVGGDIVYCSAAYGVGGGACRISKQGEGLTATQLYKIPGDKQIANHWSTPVLKDGCLYGVYGLKQYGVGPLKCVELATGQVKWSQAGFGEGNVILVGDRLLALTDTGQLVLVKASPEGYQETARAKVLEGKCWSTPALSDGRLYVRSTKEGACLDLSGH
jgi:outer membrane protein assembly factor BamB